jgi:murein L,D-transpeptidase YafK
MRQVVGTTRRLLLGLVCLLAACAKLPDETTVPQATQLKLYKMTTYRSDPWVLVDTRRDILAVMHGSQAVEVFYHVALGTAGAGIKHQRGDNVTPLGVFRIGWVNRNSRFKTFLGLDYPNLEYAKQAYRQGLISKLDYDSILYALEMGLTPPQDTPLGGSIGIHGIGAGDPWIHATYNWTSGCIALDNQQIDRLAQRVNVGTTVEIR